MTHLRLTQRGWRGINNNKKIKVAYMVDKDDCNEFHSRKYKREYYVKVSA